MVWFGAQRPPGPAASSLQR